MTSKILLERAAALLVAGNEKFEGTLGKLIEEYELKPIVLPIFKTINLGRYKNIDWFKGAFVCLQNELGDLFSKLLSRVSISPEKKEIDLVKVSVRDLTGKESATCKEIYDVALSPKFGLALCEPEDAPYLRVGYQEQPAGEILYMGMEPIVSGGCHFLFYASRLGDVRWLYASNVGRAGDVWLGSYVFVFRRPRKVS